MTEEAEKVEIDPDSPMAAMDGPPAKNAGLIASFLAMLKKLTVGQDLTSQPMAVPEGFEGKESGLERFQICALNHTDILLKANDMEDPVLRLIQILKWLFTLGHALAGKKPLNPVLGEVSICKHYSNTSAEASKDEKERDVFYSISEMASHHPPISTFVAENKARGVKIEGGSKANVKFLGTSIKISFEGTSAISFSKFNETYTYCPTPIQIRLVGFVLEYIGKMDIVCNSHPYVAHLTYKEKPVLRGKYHRLKGTIVKVNKEKSDEEVIVKFKGHWNNEVHFADLRNKQTYVFAYKDYPQPQSPPIYPSDELPSSSRNVWKGVKTAPDAASSAKAKKEVEEEQRRKAKESADKGETQAHKPVYFDSEVIDGIASWRAKPDAVQSVIF